MEQQAHLQEDGLLAAEEVLHIQLELQEHLQQDQAVLVVEEQEELQFQQELQWVMQEIQEQLTPEVEVEVYLQVILRVLQVEAVVVE
jgi:hypothetical protein